MGISYGGFKPRFARKQYPVEADVKRQIISFVNLRYGTVWNNRNVGVYVKATGRYIPSQIHYVPDIIGYTHQGRFIGIEVKQPKHRGLVDRIDHAVKVHDLTAIPKAQTRRIIGQLEFLAHIRANGGIAFMAFDVDDVIKEFEKQGGAL